ncbi:MAG: hypothetical protein Q8R92_13895 [Deltaproteobacteria bacterium]|nr:hypothetical protein [Deltaproteobacteria bacterium]
MNEPEIFSLSRGERQSALWLKLLDHFKNKLEIARAKNDGPRDVTETATLRGQIGTLKALIALDTDVPVETQ